MTIATLFLLAAAAAQPHQSWTFDTGATPTVNVSTMDGSVEVRGTTGHTASIEGTILRDDTGGKLRLDVTGGAGFVRARVCVDACEDDGDHHGRRGLHLNFHGSDGDFKVKWVLRVPEGSKLKLAAVSAPIDVQGVTGPQEIASVSGGVHVQGSTSKLKVSSVSGDVRLSPRKLAPMELNSVSGGLDLELPSHSDAALKMSSVGGTLDGQGVGMGSTRRTWGSGSVPITVSTVGGSVRIKSDTKATVSDEGKQGKRSWWGGHAGDDDDHDNQGDHDDHDEDD